MTGRRRAATFGIVFGYAGLVLALLRNILFIPLYLRSIPLSEYGAWMATGGALALLLVSDFGLSGVVTQKASARFGAGDLSELGRLAGTAMMIGVLMALALAALSLAFLPFLPGLGQLNAGAARRVADCFLIAVAANAAGLFGATALSIVRSLQRPVVAGSIMLAADMINIVLTLVGLALGWGLFSLAWGVLARSLVIGVAAPGSLWLLCRRTLGVRLSMRWNEARELLGESAQFFLSALAMKLQAQANVLFVGMILGPVSAALYTLTVRAHETVLMLLGQISAALVPSVTHLVGAGKMVRFREVVWRMLHLLGGVAAFALTMTVILNAGFLKLWVGQQAFAGQPVSIVMGAALLVSSLGYVAYDALVAQGRFKLVSRVFIATSALQVLILALLLKQGLWVAPSATLVSATVWSLSFWKAIGCTAVERRELLAPLARVSAVSILVGAAFLMLYPPVDSWVALLLEALIAGASLAAGYLIFVPRMGLMLREEFGSTLRSLRPT